MACGIVSQLENFAFAPAGGNSASSHWAIREVPQTTENEILFLQICKFIYLQNFVIENHNNFFLYFSGLII